MNDLSPVYKLTERHMRLLCQASIKVEAGQVLRGQTNINAAKELELKGFVTLSETKVGAPGVIVKITPKGREALKHEGLKAAGRI